MSESDYPGTGTLAQASRTKCARKLATASVILGILACALPWVGAAVLNASGFQAQWRPPMVGASWPVSNLPFAGTTIASLVMALAAIVTGHLAIIQAGGTVRWLFGALAGSVATALVILFFPGWHIPHDVLFIGFLVLPSLFVALAAFVFVHLPAARFTHVLQTGGATWRPVFGALLGYAAVTLIALLALSAFSKGRHSWENAVCGGNLKQIAMVLRQYSREVKGGYFPPLSSRPGVLMFSPEAIADATIRLNVDIGPLLTCPTTRFADQPTTGPASPFDDQSYFYLGYAVLNDDDVEAFAKAYRERLAEIESPEGGPFNEDLVVQIGGRTRVLHRLRDGVEQVLIAEGAGSANDPVAAVRLQDAIPVLIERNQGGHIEYPGKPPTPVPVARVLCLSDNVRRVSAGEWPMTEKTQRILAELAK